jgi:prepilin-type N-terminal cleavage/methylation domain-containing protein
MNKKRKGFTLSEVLITLTLIGVITALVVPSLVSNTDITKKTVAVKKAYNTISGAYSQASVNSRTGIRNLNELMTELEKYMNIKYYMNTSNQRQSTHGVGADSEVDAASNWIVTEDGIGYRITQNIANGGTCNTTKRQLNSGASGASACYTITIDIDGPQRGNSAAGAVTVNSTTHDVTSITGERFTAYIVSGGVTTGPSSNALAQLMDAND